MRVIPDSHLVSAGVSQLFSNYLGVPSVFARGDKSTTNPESSLHEQTDTFEHFFVDISEIKMEITKAKVSPLTSIAYVYIYSGLPQVRGII